MSQPTINSATHSTSLPAKLDCRQIIESETIKLTTESPPVESTNQYPEPIYGAIPNIIDIDGVATVIHVCRDGHYINQLLIDDPAYYRYQGSFVDAYIASSHACQPCLEIYLSQLRIAYNTQLRAYAEQLKLPSVAGNPRVVAYLKKKIAAEKTEFARNLTYITGSVCRAQCANDYDNGRKFAVLQWLYGQGAEFDASWYKTCTFLLTPEQLRWFVVRNLVTTDVLLHYAKSDHWIHVQLIFDHTTDTNVKRAAQALLAIPPENRLTINWDDFMAK